MTGFGPMIAGVDLSTKRLDMAAVPLHDQPRLGKTISLTYCDIFGTPRNEAERCYAASRAAKECLSVLHARGLDITHIAIESPWGASRKGDRALLPILGAITAALGSTPTSWWAPNEWRKQIGVHPCNNKNAGHLAVILAAQQPADYVQTGDALDAIGVAMAHRTFLLSNEDAA